MTALTAVAVLLIAAVLIGLRAGISHTARRSLGSLLAEDRQAAAERLAQTDEFTALVDAMTCQRCGWTCGGFRACRRHRPQQEAAR